MGRRPLSLASAVLIGLVSVAPGLGWAQTPPWDFSVSAFAGAAIPFKTDIRETDPTIQEDVTAKDAELDTSASFGVKIGVWTTAARAKTGLDFGVELDVTHFTPSLKEKTLSATGSLGGAPVVGVETNRITTNATIVAGNLLVRYPLGVTKDLPHGRWYPYLGVGGGGEFAHAKGGGGQANDRTGVLQALSGLKVFLTRRVGLFAEYKFTHAKHRFKTEPGMVEATNNVNHLVGGVAIHF